MRTVKRAGPKFWSPPLNMAIQFLITPTLPLQLPAALRLPVVWSLAHAKSSGLPCALKQRASPVAANSFLRCPRAPMRKHPSAQPCLSARHASPPC